MSYQFFSEAEILQATALEQNGLIGATELNTLFTESVDFINAQTAFEYGDFQPQSPGEAFTYRAELTNSYLEKGHITATDQWNAQQKATLNGFQSDAALEGLKDQPHLSEAGEYIREASLLSDYNAHGYLQPLSGVSAGNSAILQEPLEQYKFDSAFHNDLSPGGEFIRDADILGSYMNQGTWSTSDIYSADMHGLLEGPTIDYLF